MNPSSSCPVFVFSFIARSFYFQFSPPVHSLTPCNLVSALASLLMLFSVKWLMISCRLSSRLCLLISTATFLWLTSSSLFILFSCSFFVHNVNSCFIPLPLLYFKISFWSTFFFFSAYFFSVPVSSEFSPLYPLGPGQCHVYPHSKFFEGWLNAFFNLLMFVWNSTWHIPVIYDVEKWMNFDNVIQMDS